MRPDRAGYLFLLDTPLCLTRPPLRALLTARWRGFSLSPYIRRILLEVFNFDPQDSAPREAKTYYSMFRDLQTGCTLLAGREDFVLGDPPAEWRPPSQLTDADLAALETCDKLSVLPRVEVAGHCLLLDNPAACVAVMARCMAGCMPPVRGGEPFVVLCWETDPSYVPPLRISSRQFTIGTDPHASRLTEFMVRNEPPDIMLPAGVP